MGSPERRAYWLDQFRQEAQSGPVRGPSAVYAFGLSHALDDRRRRQPRGRFSCVDGISAEIAAGRRRCPSALLNSFSTIGELLWTRGTMARWRILLFDQAFAEGWEIGSLGRLRREAPALAAVLELDDRERTAELRWLWSSRASAWLKSRLRTVVSNLLNKARQIIPSSKSIPTCFSPKLSKTA